LSFFHHHRNAALTAASKTNKEGNRMRSANIIGSGPNGLAAAITLAQAGVAVTVCERNPTLGGACSTAEITLPGFRHDLGASALPMAAASPFFRSLPLAKYGFHFIQPELSLAHPLDDGSAVALTPSLADMSSQLTPDDTAAWRRFFSAVVNSWEQLVPEILSPVLHVPRHPFALARFGLPALLPATTLARTFFSDMRTRALFAGVAAHSVMPLDAPLCSAVGIVLSAAAHTVGWPVASGPQTGSQALSNALAAHLRSLGGTIHLSHEVHTLADLQPADVALFDTSARALERIAAPRLSAGFRSSLRRFKPGPGVFKVDWALSEPIPWTAEACRRAGTIHVGGTLEEIARAEAAVFAGRHPDKPFIILVQPSIADPTRASAGGHTAWGYCHVPNGSTLDRTEAIESQIARFAPGFRDVILARRTQSTPQLEAWNPNLLGGDLSGGAMTPRQLLLRPTLRGYSTSDPAIYLCSSSTPPGGGVHGMCGFHAATAALKHSQ
jgi:phytoene dehydrogenase-like protein